MKNWCSMCGGPCSLRAVMCLACANQYRKDTLRSMPSAPRSYILRRIVGGKYIKNGKAYKAGVYARLASHNPAKNSPTFALVWNRINDEVIASKRNSG